MTQTEKLLQALLDCSADVFMAAEAGGRIVYASSGAEKLFRTNRLAEKNLINLFEEETAATLFKTVRSVLFQNYPEIMELNIQNNIYNVSVSPFENKVLLCFRNISLEKDLLGRLSRNAGRTEFAERIAKLGYWELDIKTKTFFWSAEMFRIFDANPQNVSSKHNLIRERVFPEDLPLYKKQLALLLKKGRPVEGQIRLKRRGGVMYCLFKAGLHHTERKELVAGTFQDISTWIEIQHALEKARRHAEDLSLEKSSFLARASHDLRQPMQALNMFIAALDTEKMPRQQKNILSKIEQSAAGLKTLLDNLLDISKLDAGGVDYRPKTFDLSELLEKICQEYHFLLKERRLTLNCSFCAGIIIRSDPLLIERVIRNLLSNALKFASSRIKLSCRQHHNRITLRVIDDGIGISSEDMPYIFDEFYQSRDISANRREGTGLGLNIVKKISGLLNGKISVRSTPGKYTAFTFTFKY